MDLTITFFFEFHMDLFIAKKYIIYHLIYTTLTDCLLFFIATIEDDKIAAIRMLKGR